MDGNIRFHRFRYHLARGFVKPGEKVLDLGCGTGYGTDILSEVAGEVLGMDMEQSNINACREKFQRPNNEFRCVNLESVELPSSDVSVMFEVLEHLYDPKAFAEKLQESTSKFIVMSVPLGQKLRWVEEANEYQEENDSTHKSVFADEEAVLSLFSDPWKLMWGFKDGVTFIFVLYKDAVPDVL